FRLIPVLLWSYTAVVLGTAVAYVASGSLNPLWFVVALGLGALIQGWETHAINEIYDWRSGTDQADGGRALSGGSHVRNLGLLGERDLWWIFAISSVAVAVLTVWVVIERALWLAFLIVAGYGLGDRKSTRLNSSHDQISYAVFCLKKKNNNIEQLIVVHVNSPYRSMDVQQLFYSLS